MLLFSPWKQVAVILIRIETFLRGEFDSPQRSSALSFPLYLCQGKCLPCKSEIRSRVVPACLTRDFHVSVFALRDFALWPCHDCSCSERHFCPRKTPGQRDSPEWEGHVFPVLSGYLFHPIPAEGQRNPAWRAFFVRHARRQCQQQQADVCVIPRSPEREGAGWSSWGHAQRGKPPDAGHRSRSWTDVSLIFNFKKCVLHYKKSNIHKNGKNSIWISVHLSLRFNVYQDFATYNFLTLPFNFYLNI